MILFTIIMTLGIMFFFILILFFDYKYSLNLYINYIKYYDDIQIIFISIVIAFSLSCCFLYLFYLGFNIKINNFYLYCFFFVLFFIIIFLLFFIEIIFTAEYLGYFKWIQIFSSNMICPNEPFTNVETKVILYGPVNTKNGYYYYNTITKVVPKN